MLSSGSQLPFSAKFSFHSPPAKHSSQREREYLRPSEVEAMLIAARKVGRHGVRDERHYTSNVSARTANSRVNLS